ncbi:hypothetical protein BDN67DRAFT_917010 [Paxillus ammoniavirescens]|nr:hypothetical protein BDN67DRAFT_917010 [Paxillus ammoniavirescens]
MGSSKKTKPNLPEIPWGENNHACVWELINEISKSPHYKVLFRKLNKNENMSGKTKASVYKQVGGTVLPEFHSIDPAVTGDCIKAKIEILTKTYKHHAKKLRTTSGGICADEDSSPSDDEEFCEFYIKADGPDENMTDEALNIWEQIKKVFPFFLDLH